MAADEREDRDLNLDPITKEPGAHPVGTGIGAAPLYLLCGLARRRRLLSQEAALK